MREEGEDTEKSAREKLYSKRKRERGGNRGGERKKERGRERDKKRERKGKVLRHFLHSDALRNINFLRKPFEKSFTNVVFI
jgi:hypothetical protein